MRGDIKITALFRNLIGEIDTDETAFLRLIIFGTVFLAVVDKGREQAFGLASAQLRHITGDLGDDLTKGSDEFLDALPLSATRRFDTSVWKDRNVGRF